MKSKNKLLELWIAKEPFNRILDVKSKVDYEKWGHFIETKKEVFTWRENTAKGKATLSNIDLIPDSFKENVLKGHNKIRAFAEPTDDGDHKVYIDFIEESGVIGSTFEKKITKKDLTLLLKMANYLDALLLNNGDEIIDEEYIDSLPE